MRSNNKDISLKDIDSNQNEEDKNMSEGLGNIHKIRKEGMERNREMNNRGIKKIKNSKILKNNCDRLKTKIDFSDHLCSICLQFMINKVILVSCNHSFCQKCIDKITNFSKENIYHCPTCRTEFDPLNDIKLDDEYSKFVEESIFSCKYCKISGPSTFFTDHLCKISEEIETKNKFKVNKTKVVKNTVTFICPYCKMKNFDRESLVNHVSDLHSQDGKAVCPICVSHSYGDPNYETYLATHLKRRHAFDINDLIVS